MTYDMSALSVTHASFAMMYPAARASLMGHQATFALSVCLPESWRRHCFERQTKTLIKRAPFTSVLRHARAFGAEIS